MPNYDAAYTTALDDAAPGIVDIVNTQSKPGESWIDVLPRVLTTVVATEQQRQILQIQVERAKKGLPPIDSSQFGVGVNVGLSPETLKIASIGGIAILAILFLTRKKG